MRRMLAYGRSERELKGPIPPGAATSTSLAVELGWIGVLSDHTAYQDDLIHALVGRCVRHAARENWRVLVEMDEAETTAAKRDPPSAVGSRLAYPGGTVMSPGQAHVDVGRS